MGIYASGVGISNISAYPRDSARAALFSPSLPELDHKKDWLHLATTAAVNAFATDRESNRFSVGTIVTGGATEKEREKLRYRLFLDREGAGEQDQPVRLAANDVGNTSHDFMEGLDLAAFCAKKTEKPALYVFGDAHDVRSKYGVVALVLRETSDSRGFIKDNTVATIEMGATSAIDNFVERAMKGEIERRASVELHGSGMRYVAPDPLVVHAPFALLIADDEIQYLTQLIKYLESDKGFKPDEGAENQFPVQVAIRTARHGLDACEVLSNDPIGMAILDQVMGKQGTTSEELGAADQSGRYTGSYVTRTHNGARRNAGKQEREIWGMTAWYSDPKVARELTSLRTEGLMKGTISKAAGAIPGKQVRDVVFARVTPGLDLDEWGRIIVNAPVQIPALQKAS